MRFRLGIRDLNLGQGDPVDYARFMVRFESL